MIHFLNHPSKPKYKRWRSAFVLLAASSLFACGQTDISSNDSSAAPIDNTSIAAITPVSNPDLLKNISATVYKDVNCGCCGDWIEHAQAHGLHTSAEHPQNLSALKDDYGVPNAMRSCHTTVTTDGYVFEGHVPAKYVAQFLANPPEQALGLAVPNMPLRSPGMEYQNQFTAYQIMQINKNGTNQVYADIDSIEQQL